MYSRNHAIVSLVVAGLLVALGELPGHPAVVTAVVVAVGVGIDVDHFLVAWLHTGSTKNVRRALANPLIVVFDQRAIFDEDDLSELQRLLSHAVIAGLAVGGLVAVGATGWATVVGVSLYAHVLADLVADVRNEAAKREAGGL